MQSPSTATRAELLKAGNGGAWLISVLGELDFQQDNDWYQVGSLQVASTSIRAVKLTATQPEVQLTTCIDSSKVTTRFQKTGKPVPAGSSDGDRHRFLSRLVFAPPTGQTEKMWFLIEDKVAGKC
ncbi:hypothetical protein AB0I34_38605 [Kribbella sp. NPDC050281]|uniref:hypothetical protein n=1 Tax=Kribbella sp. NPDC050281 TaxID=3155515 RepID=UPI0033F3F466